MYSPAMKQLYVVTREVESLVLAESCEEAISIIRMDGEDEYSESAVPATYIPVGYDDETLPYGDHDERTLKEIILAGLAPRLIHSQFLLKVLQKNDTSTLYQLLPKAPPLEVDKFLKGVPGDLAVEIGVQMLSAIAGSKDNLKQWPGFFRTVWEQCHPFQRTLLLDPLK